MGMLRLSWQASPELEAGDAVADGGIAGRARRQLALTFAW